MKLIILIISLSLIGVFQCNPYYDCIDRELEKLPQDSSYEVYDNVYNVVCLEFMKESPFDYCLYQERELMKTEMPECTDNEYSEACWARQDQMYATCEQQQDAVQADQIEESFDYYNQYDSYFQSKEDFKQGVKDQLQVLKDELNNQELPNPQNTLDNELDAGLVEGQEELDQLYYEYKDDAAEIANEYAEDIQEAKGEMDAMLADGLADEFAEAEQELTEEEMMYQEYLAEAQANLEKEWTTGEGKELLTTEFNEQKAELMEELPEYLEEYNKGEQEVQEVMDMALTDLEEQYAGDAETMAELEEFNLTEQEALNLDAEIEEELQNFQLDSYLSIPEAAQYEVQAKEWLKTELEESKELQAEGVEEAKESIEKIKAKWETEGKAEYMEDKDMFNQWFEEAMAASKDPELEEKKYNEGKVKLEENWAAIKGKVIEEADQEGYNLTDQELYDKLKEEINAITDEDVDQYFAKLEEEQLILDDYVPDEQLTELYEEAQVPPAKKSLVKHMIIRKHK